MIIDNGCPIHNQTEILVNNIGHNVRFQSKIFEIADSFSQAWIICQVRFCDENDENCKVNDCDSVRKMHESSSSSSRKKRSLNTQLSRSKRATHASLMKGGIDDIYEVRIGPYFQKEYLSGDISGSSFNQNVKRRTSSISLGWYRCLCFIGGVCCWIDCDQKIKYLYT